MKVAKEELVMEILEAIKDLFVAEVCEVEGCLAMTFPNGQKFCLTVEEVE